jgi:hypothetical protein
VRPETPELAAGRVWEESATGLRRDRGGLDPTRVKELVARCWKWSILPLAFLYMALIAAHFQRIIANVYGSADPASGPVLGELFAHRAGGGVYLGNLAWYSTLIFELATKWLPAHLQVWEDLPYLFTLGAVALMGWAAWRVAGAWAAAVTSILLLCASPAVMGVMFWLHDHMTTWISFAMLGAFLILIETRISVGRLTLAALVLILGVLVGINAASEQIMLVAGVLPLLIAGIGTWMLHPGTRTARAAVACVVLAAIIVGVAHETTSIMQSEGVYAVPVSLRFVSMENVSANFMQWWQAITVLGNGTFFDQAISFTTVLAAACAALSVVTVVLIPRMAWRHISGARAGEAADAPLSAYLLFWASSAVLLSAALIFSSAPQTGGTQRYLVGLVFAAAAVAPLFAKRCAAAQAAVVLGTVVFSLASVISLTRSDLIAKATTGPTPAVAEGVADLAARLHLTRGYAIYWDAAPITLGSHFRVQPAPMVGCVASPGGCPGPVHFITTWYQIERAAHSFLLTDSTMEPYKPAAELGAPSAVYRIGTVTMYVFDYDIGIYIG